MYGDTFLSAKLRKVKSADLTKSSANQDLCRQHLGTNSAKNVSDLSRSSELRLKISVSHSVNSEVSGGRPVGCTVDQA